jgi:hypothetical protein
MASIQPRSSSVLMMLGLTETPRMSSISPRVARRLLVLQPRQPRLHFGAGLEAPAVGHLHELRAAPVPLSAQFLQRPAQHVARQFLLEHAPELGQRQRLDRCQQRGFQHNLQVVGIVTRLQIHAASHKWE